MDATLYDYLTLIIHEQIKESQKVLNLHQLKKSRRYLTDQIESRQLKLAMMCFKGQDVPARIRASREKLAKVQDWYSKELFWKVQEAK
jgi:hypothetical protein